MQVWIQTATVKKHQSTAHHLTDTFTAVLYNSCANEYIYCIFMSDTTSDDTVLPPVVLVHCIDSLSDNILYLRQWFMRPTVDLAMLHRRQEVIRFFASPRNSDSLSTLQSSLRNIRNIPVTTMTTDLLFATSLTFYYHTYWVIPWTLCPLIRVNLCFCVWQTLLRRMTLSHTKVIDWQNLYKVGPTLLLCTAHVTGFIKCAQRGLCVYFSDGVQCSLHQGHRASPAAVHSALSWHQWRVPWWPPSYCLSYQPRCETWIITHLQIWDMFWLLLMCSVEHSCFAEC